VAARYLIISHLPASSGRYIGSPSIAVLTDGTYIASHDVFGPTSSLGHTVVFASQDRGYNWLKRAEIMGQFWSSLFVHRDVLYLVGTGGEFGPVVIRRSLDGGYKWTTPSDGTTGLLLKGAYHTAPTPIIEHDRRLWRAMEDIAGPGGWPTHFRCFMLSVPTDADLLQAENWEKTNVLGGNSTWLNGHFNGWLEGNAVVDQRGALLDVLRVDAKPIGDKAAAVMISDDGLTASFDPAVGFLEMAGGSVKFTLRSEPAGRRYWAITNIVPTRIRTPNPGIVRNTLALVCSVDLRTWTVQAVLWHKDDTSRHGWQYVDWQFDGEDLIAVARVADDDDQGGAHDFHDANKLVFFRVSNFRCIQGTVERPYLSTSL
jgi:hypothetical protein